jgi:hypothetical protein
MGRSFTGLLVVVQGGSDRERGQTIGIDELAADDGSTTVGRLDDGLDGTADGEQGEDADDRVEEPPRRVTSGPSRWRSGGG